MNDIFVDYPRFSDSLASEPTSTRKSIRDFFGYGIQLHFICSDHDENLNQNAYEAWMSKFALGRHTKVELSTGGMLEIEEEYTPNGTKLYSLALTECDEVVWFALTEAKAKACRFHGKLHTI